MLNFDCKSEEDVKIKIVLPWLEGMGYKADVMEFEKTIQVQEGKKVKSIFADIVVYSDKKKDTPFIVVDTKSPNEVLTKQDIQQVISYARLLPKIAPIAVLTNGLTKQIYQTIDKSRIQELPERKNILKDFVKTVLSAGIQDVLRKEARKELFTIDDVATFKDLLKRCHNTIRNNEGYDPIQAFDELSKVLFAKMYEEKYNKEANRFNLETFDKTLHDLKVNIVQQQFSEIQKVPDFKDLFPTNTKIELKERTIREVVKIFEKYDLTLTRFDVKGEAFEYFLGDTFTGGLGEYFTPRNVVEFIVNIISPKIGDKIVDPFCGTGGFLIYAFEIVSEKIRINDFADEEKEKWKRELSDRCLFGTDWKPRTSQACKMNMIVHGDGNTGIHQHDGFQNIPGKIEEEKFDICFTNPPFGAHETDKNILDVYELGQGRNSQKREVLAIERCIKLVKPGKGIVAFILPDGILNGDRDSYVREFINRHTDILAVVGLNKETFEGYSATVKTSVVILKRRANPINTNNQKIFMAVCSNSGYAPTGEQVPGNQLPDILFDLNNYLNKSNSSAIFPHSKIVTIQNPSTRIDAERYIQVNEIQSREDHSKLSTSILSEIIELKLLAEKVQQALETFYTEEQFEFKEVEVLLKPVTNKIKLEKDISYSRLGVRGNGGGTFIREVSFGRDIKAKSLNLAQEGWFVYSRLFAKNGSFAYIDELHEGCLLSSEFPTFEVISNSLDKEELLEYMVSYLSSPQTIAYINMLTTGSTKQSRGRFKEQQFLKLKIPIPANKLVFTKIVHSIKLLKKLQLKIKHTSDRIKELPKSFQLSFPNIHD